MEKPAIFRHLSLSEATAQAQAERRWLIVDATAAWCQPCRLMDRTTWRDPAVVAWIEANAVAVQVDVDALDEKVAALLEVRAMPTVIAVRGDEEHDRVTGFRSASALLAWFAGLERGETEADRLPQAADGEPVDVPARYDHARALYEARRYDEALEAYVWLWQHGARILPAWSGVRASYMASDLAGLAEEHPPARVRLAELRDEAGALADSSTSELGARRDWIVLNDVLGEEPRTLAWFDRSKDDAAQAIVIDRVAHQLIRLLERVDRWADIGHLYRDPLAELRRDHRNTELPAKYADNAQVRAAVDEGFRHSVGVMFRGLRAAGRTDEAHAVATEAMQLDPSAQMRAALYPGGVS